MKKVDLKNGALTSNLFKQQGRRDSDNLTHKCKIIDSFCRMQGGANLNSCQVTVTHVYLGLGHTTSKIIAV